MVEILRRRVVFECFGTSPLQIHLRVTEQELADRALERRGRPPKESRYTRAFRGIFSDAYSAVNMPIGNFGFPTSYLKDKFYDALCLAKVATPAAAMDLAASIEVVTEREFIRLVYPEDLNNSWQPYVEEMTEQDGRKLPVIYAEFPRWTFVPTLEYPGDKMTVEQVLRMFLCLGEALGIGCRCNQGCGRFRTPTYAPIDADSYPKD